MITEGEAAIPLETTLHAFRNQEKTKQRSTIGEIKYVNNNHTFVFEIKHKFRGFLSKICQTVCYFEQKIALTP